MVKDIILIFSKNLYIGVLYKYQLPFFFEVSVVFILIIFFVNFPSFLGKKVVNFKIPYPT